MLRSKFEEQIKIDVSSENLNHGSLEDLLLNQRIDGAVEQLIHGRRAAYICLDEAFLLPNVDISHNEISIPASGNSTVTEPELKMEVSQVQALGNFIQPFEKLQGQGIFSRGKGGVEDELEG